MKIAKIEKSKIENRKLKIGNRKLYIGNWKVEIKNFLVHTNVDYQFGFGSTALSLILNSTPFWDFLGPSGLILGLGFGPKSFLGPSYID